MFLLYWYQSQVAFIPLSNDSHESPLMKMTDMAVIFFIIKNSREIHPCHHPSFVFSLSFFYLYYLKKAHDMLFLHIKPTFALKP